MTPDAADRSYKMTIDTDAVGGGLLMDVASPLSKWSVPMEVPLRSLPLIVAAGAAAAAAAIAGAPTAAGKPTCTQLNSVSTRCESSGNVEINDTLPVANVLPQWSLFGQQSGGPYGNPGGGPG
jgi:hypothetical protein